MDAPATSRRTVTRADHRARVSPCCSDHRRLSFSSASRRRLVTRDSCHTPAYDRRMVGMAAVREHEVAFGELVRAFEPDAVALPDALPLWETFDRIERLAATAKLLLTSRVDESRAGQRGGHRDSAELLARRGGTSIRAARTQLETAKRLRDLHATEQALRDGELSVDQSAVVAGTANANPAAEGRLLDQARRSSFAELRDEANRARAAGEDAEAARGRIHAARRLRTWTDAEGAWNLAARGTVEDGSRITAALRPVVERVLAQARADRRRDDHDAYALDALVTMAGTQRRAAARDKGREEAAPPRAAAPRPRRARARERPGR
jgi:hypothetical protein